MIFILNIASFFAFLSYMDATLLLFIVYPTARDNGNSPY